MRFVILMSYIVGVPLLFKKIKMSEVLKHFENSDVPDKVLCTICKKLLSSVRIHNLKAHLKTTHKMEIQNKEKPKIKPKIMKTKIEINKNEIIRSYIGLVTENGLPFDILNCDNMRNILKPIRKR